MLRRTVKIQVLAFVAIALLGVSYVAARYVGLGGSLLGQHSCTISADFADSGGIFTGAEVTYRGVGVGKVGDLHLLDDGVRVDLNLNSCSKPGVPANSTATVADRSAVGEQYVNLTPPATKPAADLADGGTLATFGKVPIATQVLITNLDLLASSVNPAQLTTTMSQLQQALAGRGPDLQQLLDSGDTLLQAATAALPQTISLIEQSTGVLQTQLDEGSALATWTRSLDLLSAQLKSSDGDLRHLLGAGPADVSTLRSFVTDNRDDLGVLLANTATVGQLLVRHLGDVEQILEMYPIALASGDTVVPGDGTAHFGLVLNLADPQDCVQGYGGTQKRTPQQTASIPPNENARCTLPRGNPSSVRGAQNAPPVEVGGSTHAASVLGDRAWLTLLTDGLQ